jgi:hypothetical protein
MPPYNTDELKQLLERYDIAEQTRLKMLDAVAKNIEQQTKSESGQQVAGPALRTDGK